MKKNQGFTLVELLAVIVILAVILVIAIPNVIKIIDKARLDSYKRTEDMLVSAAQKYMAQQGITLNTVGDTTTVSYSTDLKGNNLIDTINDQKSKTECANSKVIVTKTTTGYSYKPGLVCDSYISLDTFNLIKNSNFSNGTTGWSAVSSGNSVTNNILLNTADGTATSPYARNDASNLPLTVSGRKYYVKMIARVTNSNCTQLRFRLFNVDIGDTPKYNPIQNQWYYLSNNLTATADGSLAIYMVHVYGTTGAALGAVMEVKEVMAFDLTSIYGSTTPTASQIDILIDKSR
jgi:prepilin-type N-terminal cleavage/methylation domain-containing protein